MSVTVQCYLTPLSNRYSDGLERVEAYVRPQWEPLVPKPPAGQRVTITLVTQTGRYRGGLRTYPKKEQIYICPDLTTIPAGTRTSLAKLLDENGYRPKDYVDFIVENEVWKLKKP